MTIWRIFPRKVKNIILTWSGACEMRLKQTLEMNIGGGVCSHPSQMGASSRGWDQMGAAVWPRWKQGPDVGKGGVRWEHGPDGGRSVGSDGSMDQMRERVGSDGSMDQMRVEDGSDGSRGQIGTSPYLPM